MAITRDRFGGEDAVQALLKDTDSRYTGYAREALGPTWVKMPDPIAAMQDAARRRAEAEAARMTALAAAERAKALPSVFNTQPGVTRDPAPALSGPMAPPAGLTPLGPVPTPDAAVDNRFTRIDTYGSMRGPEKAGYTQSEVYDENGKVTGWQYIPVPGRVSEDTGKPLSIGSERKPVKVPHSAMLPIDEEGMGEIRHAYPEASIDGKTWQEEEADLTRQLAYMQTQIYGEPVLQEDGSYAYRSDKMLYYGIDTDHQAMGWVPHMRPDPLPKNPTDAEKMRYIAQLRNMWRTPLYKVGSVNDHLLGLGRQGKIDLQKKLKAAGMYETNYVIVPGQFRTGDITALEQAMGEANVTGLELNDTLTLLATARKDALARAKAAGGGGGGGGGDMTRQVQITFPQTSVAQGRALLAQILQNALGRSPSDQELAQFMTRLNAAESKSPTKTVTNYVRSGSTTTATSRTNPSDVDAEAMARQFAAEINGGEEMFDMQANSYLDGLMQMLMGSQNV